MWHRHTMSANPPHVLVPLNLFTSDVPSACSCASLSHKQLSTDGSDLHVLYEWVSAGAVPPVCQVLTGFQGSRGGRWKRERLTHGLELVGFHLGSCIQEPGAQFERCTFFSSEQCNQPRYAWPA